MKRKLTLILVLMLLGAASVSIPLSAVAEPVTPAAENSYEFALDGAAEINENFTAGYIERFLSRVNHEEVQSAPSTRFHWQVEDFVLKRKNGIDTTGQKYTADSIAMLTFSKQKFTNFELSVDMKMGSDTTFWPVISVRQDEPLKHFLEDGIGLYLEAEGNLRTWGRGLNGGPWTVKAFNGYERNEWHRWTVKAEGNLFTITVQNLNSPQLKLECTLRSGWNFYRPGYVTLMSFNNSSEFRNFKIAALPDSVVTGDPEPQPVPTPEGDSNSLDELAGGEASGYGDKVDKVKYAPGIEFNGMLTGFIIMAALIVLLGAAFATYLVLGSKKPEAAMETESDEKPDTNDNSDK